LAEKKIKRSWVRRLAPAKELRSNEIAQNFSPIVLSDGHVIQASSFGSIFEVSPHGRKVWSSDLNLGAVVGEGSVYKRFVFFGTEDKKIHAFDRKNKKVIWSVKLRSGVSAISNFKDGRIFVLTDQGQFYALKAASGETVWKKSFLSRKALKIYGGVKPALFKDQVLCAFPNGVVASFDQATGSSKWSLSLPGSQKYQDADFMLLTDNADLYVGTYDEALYKINVFKGNVIWQAFERPVSGPALHLGKIYFAAADGDLVVLRSDSGKLVSKTKLFKGVGGKPLFLKNSFVVSDSKGPLKVFESRTLNLITTYDLISPTSADLAVNKSKSKFFVLSDKGYLYSFGLK
jgi:outer membrane protein assembly factor BamB